MMQRDQARTRPLSPRRLVWLTVLAASFGIAIHVAAKPIQGPPSKAASDELPGLAVAPAPIVQDVVVLPAHASGDSPAKSAAFTRPDDSQAQMPDEDAVRFPDNDRHQVDPDVRVRRYELSDWIEDESFQPVAYFFDDPPTRVSDLGNHDRLTDNETSTEVVWPRAKTLLLTTDKLANWTAVSVWRYELSAILENLSLLETIHDSRVPTILTHLRKLADQLDAHIIANSATPAVSPDAAQGVLSDELRRLQHQIRIRADIWSAAHELGCCQFDTIGDFHQASFRPSQPGADHGWLPYLDPTWREYIELDELQSAWQTAETDAAQLRTAARRTLARLSSPNLNAEQNDYLRQAISPEVVEWLIRQARGPCDLPDLLRHLESYLETSHGYHAAAIAETYQNLVWHDHPRYQALAQQIETHLRNPNVRISASDILLNLLLPDLPDVEEPVRENILGANVLGRSRVANRLQVRLLPDPDKINLRLDAIGLVRSSTQATRGGFVVDNLGTTRFQASKPLVIGRHGLAVGPPQAMADSDNQVVGLRSNFDGIPFLAGFARRMAQNQIASQKPAATHQMNRRVEQRVKHQLDLEIDSQLDELRSFFYQGVIQPLSALDLEPLAVETRTTHDRMIMRYRLAGMDQLSAATLRPGGVQSSLLAIQLHQSAINNLLSRIELTDRVFTPEQLTQHLSEVFGVEFQPDPRATDVEARMEFAPFDPIAISFEEGMIAIKLNLRQLQVGRGRVWKRVSVAVRYIPHVRGSQVVLEQEPNGVRLLSHQQNGRDQMAILGIFNAIFKSKYELSLIPDTLQRRLGRPIDISQFEITDGWLAISLDARRTEPTATQPRQARGFADRFHP